MCLIMDGFPTRKAADDCVKRMAFLGFDAKAYDSQDESDEDDPFPYVLVAPIVLVERTEANDNREKVAIHAATLFGGRFAGT